MIHMIFIFTFFLLSGVGSVQAADAWAAQEEAFLAYSQVHEDAAAPAFRALCFLEETVGEEHVAHSWSKLTAEQQASIREVEFLKESPFDDAFVAAYMGSYGEKDEQPYVRGSMVALTIYMLRLYKFVSPAEGASPVRRKQRKPTRLGEPPRADGSASMEEEFLAFVQKSEKARRAHDLFRDLIRTHSVAEVTSKLVAQFTYADLNDLCPPGIGNTFLKMYMSRHKDDIEGQHAIGLVAALVAYKLRGKMQKDVSFLNFARSKAPQARVVFNIIGILEKVVGRDRAEHSLHTFIRKVRHLDLHASDFDNSFLVDYVGRVQGAGEGPHLIGLMVASAIRAVRDNIEAPAAAGAGVPGPFAGEYAFLEFARANHNWVHEAFRILCSPIGLVSRQDIEDAWRELSVVKQEKLRLAVTKEASVFGDEFLISYINRHLRTVDNSCFRGLVAALVIYMARHCLKISRGPVSGALNPGVIETGSKKVSKKRKKAFGVSMFTKGECRGEGSCTCSFDNQCYYFEEAVEAVVSMCHRSEDYLENIKAYFCESRESVVDILKRAKNGMLTYGIFPQLVGGGCLRFLSEHQAFLHLVKQPSDEAYWRLSMAEMIEDMPNDDNKWRYIMTYYFVHVLLKDRYRSEKNRQKRPAPTAVSATASAAPNADTIETESETDSDDDQPRYAPRRRVKIEAV